MNLATLTLVYDEVPDCSGDRDPQRRDFGNLAGSGRLGRPEKDDTH